LYHLNPSKTHILRFKKFDGCLTGTSQKQPEMTRNNPKRSDEKATTAGAILDLRGQCPKPLDDGGKQFCSAKLQSI